MHIDQLLAHGAESVAGDILFESKSIGRMLGGEFVPSEHGLRVMAELSEKPVAAKKVAAKKVAKPKAETPAETPAEGDLGDLSDILGDE